MASLGVNKMGICKSRIFIKKLKCVLEGIISYVGYKLNKEQNILLKEFNCNGRELSK